MIPLASRNVRRQSGRQRWLLGLRCRRRSSAVPADHARHRDTSAPKDRVRVSNILEGALFELRWVVSILLRCMSRKSWTRSPATHEFCERHGCFGSNRFSIVKVRRGALARKFEQGFFLALLFSERARRR